MGGRGGAAGHDCAARVPTLAHLCRRGWLARTALAALLGRGARGRAAPPSDAAAAQQGGASTARVQRNGLPCLLELRRHRPRPHTTPLAAALPPLSPPPADGRTASCIQSCTASLPHRRALTTPPPSFFHHGLLSRALIGLRWSTAHTSTRPACARPSPPQRESSPSLTTRASRAICPSSGRRDGATSRASSASPCASASGAASRARRSIDRGLTPFCSACTACPVTLRPLPHATRTHGAR